MQLDEVVRQLIERSGRSARAVSQELGHVPTWANSVGASGRVPSLGTVADVADVAGVDVTLVDRATGETLGTIEPPRRTRQAQHSDEAEQD